MQGLGEDPEPLRVLAVFDHAWDLVAADGRVVALVTPRIGNGPLNIVIGTRLSNLPRPSPGEPALIDRHSLRLGEVEVILACPEWDPRPDWPTLRARYPHSRSGADSRSPRSRARTKSRLAATDRTR